MAESKPISSAELIEKGIFIDARQEAKDLTTVINTLNISFSKLVKIQKDGLADIKKIGGATDAKSLKATSDALNKVTESRKKAQEVDKDRLTFTKKLEPARKHELADFEKQKKNSDEYIRSQAIRSIVDKARIARLKAIAIEQSKEIGLEQKLLATNARLRLDRAALTGLEGDYKVQLTAINDQLDKNNALIKENSDKQKQQALTVGDYKNQIKEALAETTGFGRVISKVSGFVNAFEETLKAQKVAQAESALATTGDTIAHERNIAAIKAEEAATQKLSLAKRALNAITSPVGLLLLAIAAAAALAKAIYDVNQAAQDTFNINVVARYNDVLLGTGSSFRDLAKAQILFRDSSRLLELELQKLNDVSEDSARIANDETIAIGLRDIAAKKAANARVTAAIAEVDIEKQKKALIDQEIKAYESSPFIKNRDAIASLYDKQKESAMKLFEATDKLNDLEVINAEDERKRFQDRITQEIELIRSKKLGADSAVETLKKQVDDETTILSNRRSALSKLEAEQLKAQNAETELLEQFGLKKAEIDDMIATKDAVSLQRKLKVFGTDKKNFLLSQNQIEELAKVVTETQKNELDRLSQKAKLDEKAIENKKELASLENQLLQQQLLQGVLRSEQQLKEKELLTSRAKDDALSETFLFSKKKQKALEESYKEEKEAANVLAEDKKTIIEDQYENEIKLIKDQILAKTKEEEIGLAEIKLLQEKFNNEKTLITKELAEKEKKIQEDADESARQISVRRTDRVLGQIGQVTAALEQELDKRNALESKQADRAISKQESTIDKQRNLAERGLDNTLAFEEQRREEMELANRDREERNAKIQEALQLAQTFNAFLQAALKQTPAPSGVQAITQATTNTFLAKGIAKGLVTLYEDGGLLEGNSHDKGGIKGTGSFSNVEVEGGEFIVNKKATAKNLNILEKINANVDVSKEMQWMPNVDFIKVSQNSMAQNIANSLQIQNNNEVKQLLTDIKNKPVQMVNVDQLGQLVETVYKNGVKHVTTHVQTRKRV